MTDPIGLPEQGPEAPHVTTLRIPLYEVDLGQGVYHGNYFHLFELAREAFLRDIGHPYPQLMAQGVHLTIVELSCTYRRPLRYDDRVVIETRVGWIRRRSLNFAQRILRPTADDPAGERCTEAAFNMVCVSFEGRPTALPADFAEGLRGWLSNGERG